MVNENEAWVYNGWNRSHSYFQLNQSQLSKTRQNNHPLKWKAVSPMMIIISSVSRRSEGGLDVKQLLRMR